MDSRGFVLRNRQRTNLALGLMRVDLNVQDIERHYLALLRERLTSYHGTLPRQRQGADTGTSTRLPWERRAVPSLRR